MKKLSTLFLLWLLYISAIAQYETVVFNYENSTFNENQPLPAESNLMLTGEISSEIQMIEVRIYRSEGSEGKRPLYTSNWKRSYNNISERFNLPINYKLRGGQEYDVEIVYYSALSLEDKAQLRSDLFQILDDYIDMVYTAGRKKISLSKQHNSILNDLNSVVKSGMQLYRNKNDFYFESFSDLVKLKLKQIDDVNLKKQRSILEEDSTRVIQTKEKLIGELKQVVRGELKQYLNAELLVSRELKLMKDYSTEKTRNEIALNAGYAAAFFNGDFKNLDYGSSAYVGISVPLANRKLSSAFLSNTSISAGVLLQKMENNEGNTVRGPFVTVPVYLGLGYKIFRIIRLNIGATLLEEELMNSKKVMIRPFVGASIDVNFWMGIGKK